MKEDIKKLTAEVKRLQKEIQLLTNKTYKEHNRYFELSKLVPKGLMFKDENAKAAGFTDNLFMSLRTGGNYAGKSFYLSPDYEWQMVRDSFDHIVLVPMRKSEE